MGSNQIKETIPLIGISSCLTGAVVRYDGSHELNSFIINSLRDRAELVCVCPETQCGMPVPREPMDLFETPYGVRLLTVNTFRNLTHMLSSWCIAKADELASAGVSGFILKSGSPSCGIGSARLHSDGNLHRNGMGFFAEALLNRCPGMPVVQEDKLLKKDNIEQFLDRVRSYNGG
ncbi:hypothetical protein CSA37_06660 [Candidatus Fermentibacteria bacterium]|nr:MAG: hypothetical protein CSA37_06660 [Candidatus Fermentibacteria bacterium]